MSKLLHIDSSILGGNSVSRQLTAQIVTSWRASHPGTEVTYLDLAVDTPSHLSAESLGFRMPAGVPLSEVQQRENAISEKLVSQFLAADTIVIGAPLYNFTIPTQLKAWIDRIAQTGRTFAYTDKGPVGLAGGKTSSWRRHGAVSTRPAMPATPWNTRKATSEPSSVFWVSPMCASCGPKAWPWAMRSKTRP